MTGIQEFVTRRSCIIVIVFVAAVAVVMIKNGPERTVEVVLNWLTSVVWCGVLYLTIPL